MFVGRRILCGMRDRIISYRLVLQLKPYQLNQTYISDLLVLVMFVNPAASVAILISLIVCVTANPSCDDRYGRPVGADCRRILESFTGPRPAREPVRCFAPASMTQPEYVSNSEWLQKVDIPKFWTRSRYFRTPPWPC